MASLTIQKAGLLTSIQDMGRSGLAYYAIPPSGVMDERAARIALLLLELPEDSPLVECTSVAPQLVFHAEAEIALSGADFAWSINGQLVPLHTVLAVKEGDVLHGKMAQNALRGYIAIRGDWGMERVYGAYATYANAKIGGHEGRLLRKGDIIKWAPWPSLYTNPKFIPLHPGPEYEYLTEKGKAQLRQQTFTVSPDSNRMGLRLAGMPIEATVYQLAQSRPVLPGFMQLPPSGQPIVVLQDGQTTGGYPRIAYVKAKDLWRLNQVSLGASIKIEMA